MSSLENLPVFIRWLNACGEVPNALASSACLTAAEANKKYSLRNNSEVCYKFIKGHLGFDVTRVHSESSIRAKFFECFLGSIVRYFILLGARSAAISTNVALRELSLLEMHLLPGDIYTMIHTENGRQLALLKALNVGPDRFDAIADVENRHIEQPHAVHARERKKPIDQVHQGSLVVKHIAVHDQTVLNPTGTAHIDAYVGRIVAVAPQCHRVG